MLGSQNKCPLQTQESEKCLEESEKQHRKGILRETEPYRQLHWDRRVNEAFCRGPSQMGLELRVGLGGLKRTGTVVFL